MNMMKVTPQTIPGTLHLQNKSAFDWGWQGLLAYGCHSTVVVVDPRIVQLAQTLSHHKSNVIKIRWSQECYHHTLATPYTLRLVSVDNGSHCVVWDVTQGTVISEFALGGKPLVDIQWLNTNDACRDLLAVMLSPSSMTIWNADTGIKVSRFTFTETIMAFTFNPFQPDNLILQSQDCFIFVSDFNPSRTPTGGGKKLYMTTSGNSSITSPIYSRGKSPTSRQLLSGGSIKGEESIPLSDCLQVTFSRSCRHHLFVVYAREIVIMDIGTKQEVGSIVLERNSSPFLQVMPCKQRSMLYCLHENGSVSIRIQQSLQFPDSIPVSPLDSRPQGVNYEFYCHSEAIRISKTCHVYAGAFCPTTEKRVAVLTSEGKILLLDLEFECVGIYGQELTEEIGPTMLTALPMRAGLVGLVDLRGEDEGYDDGDGVGLTLGDTIAPHWFFPPDGSTSTYGLLEPRLILGGLWSGISGTPTVIRMCPPLTTKNWSFYTPLLAVGSTNGSILVFNLSLRTLVKEFAVHTCAVHGIEWLNQTSFVTYAHTQPNPSGYVRNEIAKTDLQTGRVVYLKRTELDSNNQTPIDAIKISTHKNYLVVKYKDRPLEFWDARALTFVREIVTNPSCFNCIEWSPSHNRSKPPKTEPLSSASTVDFDVALGTSNSQSPEKELLTVMDSGGAMWQISIEGSKVRVVHSAPTETWLNNPTCITWKGEMMVAGDSEGMLFFYDSKTPSRNVETTRSVVKKLRFAPGKGNLKMIALYNTRIDIREGDGVLGQLKWGSKDASPHPCPVEDADWATSDKPVLLTSDCCVRVYDIKLQHCQTLISTQSFAEPMFCPCAVPPQSALQLKCMLQHQPWNLEYSLDAEEFDDMDVIQKNVNSQLQILPEEFRNSLLDASLGTPQRCLIAASLYGNEREVDFWTVALYYMLREKNRRQDPRYSVYRSMPPRTPTSDIIRPDSNAATSIVSSLSKSMDEIFGPLSDFSEGDSPIPTSPTIPLEDTQMELSARDIAAMLQEANLKSLMDTPPLDLCYDLFCDSETYQRMQLDRVLLHDCKRQTYDHTRKCIETLLLLGQTDRAVQLLLETDSSSSHYYTNALEACLAATIRSSGASQSTIKLVATSLIANSKLMEGVQLLCLIDKGQDACRYLQTYGEWYCSVWLAKATLGEQGCTDTLMRWADHLSSVGINQKNKSLLVLLSLGQYVKVIEMLHSMRYFEQAAVFTEACLEYRLIKINKENTSLVEMVFLEYARYLQSLGLTRGMRHYCGKAGGKGAELLELHLSGGHKKKLQQSSPNFGELVT